jgi:hypothetical protein
MYEYTSLDYFLKSLKCHKPQLTDHTIDIFYIVDEDGEGVEYSIWNGKLKDCDFDNPLFKNYRYLWSALSAYSGHIIDICCERVEE